MLPLPRRLLAAITFGTLAAPWPPGRTLRAQMTSGCWSEPADTAPAVGRLAAAMSQRELRAVRLDGSRPVIDGHLDEPQWCRAPAGGDLVQTEPNPGALATVPTRFRVLYDDDAVYVAVRLHDPSPDSILVPWPRRDDETTSDWVFVEIDGRLDRRSAVTFGVNPRGVQADGSWANDGDYDEAWNAVYSAAAAVDARGWTAEFRIPWSQVPLSRNAAGDPLVWGFNVFRNTPHRGEVSNWSPRMPGLAGIVSRFNRLVGLVVPPRAARLELATHGAATGTRSPDGAGRSLGAGIDVRLRPTPSSAVALTVRPDFGQVEADPSQINLTTFETFLPEQRPLFLAAGSQLQFASALPFESRGTSFAEERPFYSRRIGRPPHGVLPDSARSPDVPAASTVLAGLRVSGRTPGGWSAAAFHAWTGEETASYTGSSGGRLRLTVEPRTHYTAARVERGSGTGATTTGVMATWVERPGMTASLAAMLPRRALLAGADFRSRLAGNRFEVSGFALASRVEGSAPAIEALRLEPRHGYGRPDAAPAPGATTALSGASAQARLEQLAGRLRWGLAGRFVSRGFEMNDVGFQRNADWLLAVAAWEYERSRAGRAVRRWSVGSRQIGVGWTVNGRRRAAAANLTGAADFANYWGAELALDHEFPALDPEVLRGGPALPLPARDRVTFSGYTDTRKRWLLTLTVSGEREPLSRSSGASIAAEFSDFVTDRLQLGVAPMLESVTEGWQYAAAVRDGSGARRDFLGRLRSRTTSVVARATYAFSTHLTLQGYAQGFLSGGQFDTFKEVVASRVLDIAPARVRVDRVAGRVVIDPGTATSAGFADPAFSERTVQLNMVLRWEFRPGSTLFVVWSRHGSDPAVRPFDAGRDLGRLWRAPATDALLVKIRYWFAP